MQYLLLIFKDIKTINKNFVAHAQGKTLAPTKLGRTKKMNDKRDKVYDIYCIQNELNKLELKARTNI